MEQDSNIVTHCKMKDRYGLMLQQWIRFIWWEWQRKNSATCTGICRQYVSFSRRIWGRGFCLKTVCQLKVVCVAETDKETCHLLERKRGSGKNIISLGFTILNRLWWDIRREQSTGFIWKNRNISAGRKYCRIDFHSEGHVLLVGQMISEEYDHRRMYGSWVPK